jgi:NTE family protein
MVLRSGQLVPALRATSALPGLLSPVKYQGRYLVDGGLLNNLPVDLIRTMTHDPVIAVDIAAPPDRELAFESETAGILQQMNALISGKTTMRNELFGRGLTVELFMKSFDVPQRVLTEMRLSIQPPELLIRPELDSQFGVEDFDRGEEAIAQGYEATHQGLKNWLKADEQNKEIPSS